MTPGIEGKSAGGVLERGEFLEEIRSIKGSDQHITLFLFLLLFFPLLFFLYSFSYPFKFPFLPSILNLPKIQESLSVILDSGS